MSRTNSLFSRKNDARFIFLYGEGIGDTFSLPNGSLVDFLDGVTQSALESGYDRVVHISPTKPIHTIDPYSQRNSAGYIWPHRGEVIRTGVIEGIQSGPFGPPSKRDEPNLLTSPSNQPGLGDVHGIRIADAMMKDLNHSTVLCIFNSDLYLEAFDDPRTLFGLINEWFLLPVSNRNRVLFIFPRLNSKTLNEKLETMALPFWTPESDQTSTIVESIAVHGPDLDEVTGWLQGRLDRGAIQCHEEQFERICKWITAENQLLRTWVTRLEHIEEVSINLLIQNGWISAVNDNFRPFREKIDRLEGLEEIKKRFVEMEAWMGFQAYLKDENHHPANHMLFLGNPGTGKTTVARLYGEMLHEYGFLEKGHLVEVKGADLIASHVGGTGEKTNKVIDQAIGGVLFIDEAYSLSEEGRGGYGQEALELILARMENDRGKLAVVIAGYPAKMSLFLDSNPGLSRRFPEENRFYFPDFNADELFKILLSDLDQRGLGHSELIDGMLREVVQELVHTKDENFGNAGEIRNLGDAIERKCKARSYSLSLNKAVIEPLDIPERYRISEKIVDSDTGDLFDIFRGMVGLDGVQEHLISILRTVQYERYRAQVEGQTHAPIRPDHFVFFGNPGTGKTTVARWLGKLYRRMGILRKGHTVEVNAADLVAGFVGQTPEKTRKIIRSALDGVLFIDEAYALTRNSQQGQTNYGIEAIDMVVKMMEDYKDRLVVIAAGYPHNMRQFLSVNPGLKSRFSVFLDFPDFSDDQLLEIFARLCETNQLSFAEGVGQNFIDLVHSIKTSWPEAFGNAREVNRIFTYMCRKLAARVFEGLPLDGIPDGVIAGWNELQSVDMAGYPVPAPDQQEPRSYSHALEDYLFNVRRSH